MSAEAKSVEKAPVWFISHGGGPCFFMTGERGSPFVDIDKHSKAAEWYRQLTKQLKIQKPTAIVVVSAHWETANQVYVTAQDQPDLYYDYYGFPDETYQLKYPCPGQPQLAQQICDLVRKAGVKCTEDRKRGLDHGVFIPLKLIYPNADIPVVQLSILNSWDYDTHVKIGRALAPLRDQGVLILASGQATHGRIPGGKPGVEMTTQWIEALTQLLTSTVGENRVNALRKWENLPHAKKHHARPEHFVPMFVAIGAAGDDACELIGDHIGMIDFGAMSLASYQFASNPLVAEAQPSVAPAKRSEEL